MPTLADLKAAHLKWCFTCGKTNLHPDGIHTCHDHPVIAALIAKAKEDEARIEEQRLQIISDSNWATQVMLERDQRVSDCQSLNRQLTAEREALVREAERHPRSNQKEGE